jgi:hypothetical protein
VLACRHGHVAGEHHRISEPQRQPCRLAIEKSDGRHGAKNICFFPLTKLSVSSTTLFVLIGNKNRKVV